MDKAITQEHIQRLETQGVQIIGPEEGEQACGETGGGRMSEPAKILAVLTRQVTPKFFKNINILITAGPTREALDPVRYISNRSSGKMGYALAEAALYAGANVTLVSGPVTIAAPDKLNLVAVETAEQMYQAVISRIPEQHVLCCCGCC